MGVGLFHNGLWISLPEAGPYGDPSFYPKICPGEISPQRPVALLSPSSQWQRATQAMLEALPWFIVLALVAGLLGYMTGRRAGSRRPADARRDPGQAGAGETRQPAPPPGNRPARAEPAPASPPVPASAEPAAVPNLTAVRSWGYQLQDIDVARAAASPFDLLVLDRTRDGSEATLLRPSDLQRLQRKPDGSRRIVLSYCSIGEAENYRSYWRPEWKRTKPGWMLGENPDWEGNYSVRFWEADWQRLVFGSPDAEVDRIVAQGFDGIYVDKCDVVDDLREHFKAAAGSRKDLDGDMVEFVRKLSAYAKSKRPGFLIVMQNAEALLERPPLRAAIDGVAKEELVFGVETPEKLNSRDDFDYSREMLDLARKDGKPVFVVEYLANAAKIERARESARSLGYILYVAPKDRELDRLAVAPASLT